MPLHRLLAHLAELCRRHAWLVVLASVLLAALSGIYAAHHLGVSTNTDEMFAASLPWRQRADRATTATSRSSSDLLVAVIDAQEPEEADATAAELAEALAADHAHFLSVRRPDASPYPAQGGAAVPRHRSSCRTCWTAPSTRSPSSASSSPIRRRAACSRRCRCSAWASSKGDADLTPVRHGAAGVPPGDGARARRPPDSRCPGSACWAASLSDLAGKYRFVLVQPQQDYGALQPGGAATDAMRAVDRRPALRARPARRGCASPARWRWPTRSSPPSPRARSRG